MAENQTRTKAEIQSEMAAARDSLAANVESLINLVHPKAVVQRSIDDARTFAAAELASAKSQVVREDGSLRVERLALIAGAVAGTVTFVWLVRSIFAR